MFERRRSLGIRGGDQVAAGIMGEVLMGTVGVVLANQQTPAVVAIVNALAPTIERLDEISRRVVGKLLGVAVGIVDGREIAVGVVAVSGLNDTLIAITQDVIERQIVRLVGLSAERINQASEIAPGIIAVQDREILRRQSTNQPAIGIITESLDAAQRVPAFGDLAGFVEE